MQIEKAIKRTVAGLLLLLPMAVAAQSSSINTFSPYTFYGIGDFSTPGTANLRSMGGVGVGFREPISINYLNPASYSVIQQRSFLLNFGMEGQNFYSKSSVAKNSYNTFNVRDVAIQFPLAKKLGFGFVVTPLSNVGYRVEMTETDPNIVANLGDVKYKYVGEGGITQIKAGLGWEVFKNFSIGAEMIYYLGNIERSFNTEITVITGDGTYNNLTATNTENVSRVFADFGLQYDVIRNSKRMLTLGATYQLGGSLRPQVKRYIPSGNFVGDTVAFSQTTSPFKLPSTLSVGMFYRTAKIGVGADYVFQKWNGINADDLENNIRYVNTNTVKLGMQITPNLYDIRHFMKRLTYRFGFRYSDYYMQFGGEKIADKAVTLGVGIPIKTQGLSNINVGLEFGQRGTTQKALIRERYLKFSIGLSLFGEDYWFRKMKYD